MTRTATVVVLFVSSCTSVPHYVLMDRSANPVPATEVDVFLPDDEIPENCERVAFLFARRNWHFTYGSLRNSLREDAGDYGANAVHLRFTSEESMAVFSGTPAPFGGMERDVDAIALYCPPRYAGAAPGGSLTGGSRSRPGAASGPGPWAAAT